MKTYGVNVERTLTVTIYVAADTEQQALEKADKMNGVLHVHGIAEPPVMPHQVVTWPSGIKGGVIGE